MKRLLLILAIVLMASNAFALTATWEYDAVEAERVERFWLYFAEEPGGPYTSLLDIEKVANQTEYTTTIARETLPSSTIYFVMTAEGASGESDFSNEASINLAPMPIPFNLKIILE